MVNETSARAFSDKQNELAKEKKTAELRENLRDQLNIEALFELRNQTVELKEQNEKLQKEYEILDKEFKSNKRATILSLVIGGFGLIIAIVSLIFDFII